METGKPVHIGSASAQTQRRMDIQAPLTAVYIHAVPALPPLPPLPVQQPFPQARPNTNATAAANAAREPATLHLAMPPLYSKETLPFLTLHIAGGVHAQPGLSLATAAAAPPVSTRPKSAGKHVCPHCGRDCMKPSVLEKHLRCHTGERPYPCTTCGVSFKTQSNLYKHKRTQAHARQSSESSSVDSASGSRETSGLSLDESGSVVKDATAEESQRPGSTDNSDQETSTSAGRPEKPAVSAGRHLPLQRQEATLFSKQWETSVSRGKSQSHESTDSGFSESSDHYPSPGSLLPDHSMDSLAESTKEHLEEIPQGLCPGAQEPKCSAATLEERISKLISQNSAVVEDKQLENVRPRKTVLSKQGSIDLPMPYTYKDSFHFDMRIGKTPNVGSQRARRPDYYSSVPAQRSGTVDHAPLTRSNSLPFSVALLQPERSSPTSPDYVTLARRGSSGQINPTGFAVKPANQHPSTHRPLVRQTAVDGNHATDGLSVNSSVEEASAATTAIATGSLSLDGDGGDICGEPSNRKFRRKKAQKFAYNKWYMYGGGGTFKKLYGGDDGKDRKCPANAEHEQPKRSAVHKETVTTMNFTSSSATACNAGGASVILKASQLHTSCSSLKTPLRRNLSLSVLPLSSVGSLASYKTDAESGRSIDGDSGSASELRGAVHVPSDRKKQKTDDKMTSSLEMETNRHTAACPQLDANLSYSQINQKHAVFPTCIINRKTTAPSAANFLPKYQLKLPNAEPQAVDKPADTQSKTAENQSENPNALSSAPHQLPLPRCGADAAPHTTSSGAAERLAATTTTTANFLQHDEAGSCTASIQASKSAGVSTPAQPPPAAAAAAAPVVVQLPATPTAANNQSSAASSQCQPNPNPAPVHAPLSTVHSNAPVVPCNIVPDAHNVFHVHTADLQICLQIISDEQLALIEPQIERPAGSGVMVDTAAVAAAVASSSQGSVEAQQSAATFTTKSQKAELGQSELSRSTQDTAFSDPHPHKHGGVNTAAVTQSSSGGVMESGTSVDEENVTLEVWSGQHELYVPPKHQPAPCKAAAMDANPNKLGLGAAELSDSESTLQVSLDSSSYANLEISSQEVALSDDVITSTNSDKPNEKFPSHEERAKDVQTVAGSPTAAPTERCGEQEVGNVRRTEPENRGTGAQSLQDARRSKGEDGELNVDPARSQTLPAPCEHPQETPTQTCILNSTSQTHTNVSHTHWETQTHNYDQTGSTSHHHHHQHEQKHRNDVATTSVHFLLPPEQLTTEPDPGGYHDDRDYNKYQSFFLSGQIHGYHAVDGVRPVQSCQDYTEDTSSSDDEGKLIIEL